MQKNEKIGVFGCAADPFTVAHREIVKQVLAQHAVDSVLIEPSIVDWHRQGKTVWLNSEQKVDVIKALTRGLGLVYVDDADLRRKSLCSGSEALEASVRSWRFIDTLVRLLLDGPSDGREFWPVIGSDELLNFKNWYAWEDVLRLSGGIIAVVGRNGEAFDEEKFLSENPEFRGKLKTVRIDGRFAGVSASAVREKYAGRSLIEYISDALAEIDTDASAASAVLLHTPIFDIEKGEKTDTGLEPVIVRAPDWVTVIVERGGEFLFEKQFRYGACRIVDEFPCGMVEPGEDPEAAAIRELEEETGIRVGRVEKIGETSPNPAFMTNMMHYFYVDLDTEPYEQVGQRLDCHEKFEFGWKSKKDFAERLFAGARADGGRVPAMALTALKLYEEFQGRAFGSK